MKPLKLLPNRFKLIGLLICIFIIPLIFSLEYIFRDLKHNPELLKSISSISIIAGFALIIFSKEKIEDEFIEHCRLRAFAAAFIVGIVSYIINEIFDIIDTDTNKTIFQLLFNQCLFYFAVFYLLKNNLVSKNEKQSKRNSGI